MKFDYVNTQPCGCRVVFKMVDKGKVSEVIYCKEHKEDDTGEKALDRVNVVERAKGQLKELQGG